MNDESIVLTLHRNIFALNERQIDTENVTAVCLRESLAGLRRGPVVCVPSTRYKLAVAVMRYFSFAPAAMRFIRRRAGRLKEPGPNEYR